MAGVPLGVPEDVAKKHGFIALPRPYAPPRPQFVVSPEAILAAVERALAPAVRRLKAARLKRERARRKAYFAKWYAINRMAVAARRKAQRQVTASA